jgi:hypothetical protein
MLVMTGTARVTPRTAARLDSGAAMIKIDGYRAQVHIRHGEVKVYSRSGYDWTEQFGQIARAAAALAPHDLIIAARRRCSAIPDCRIFRRCGASWLSRIPVG